MSCHVMSCHVAIIVSKFLKKSFSKTFLFYTIITIIYKYFAGFFACVHTIRSNYKNFQFDKFQRFLSVIYKKIHLKGDFQS